MEPGHHTDPLEEALNHGSQRVAQFASLAGAMGQVVIQRRALHNARTSARNDERATQVLDEQERLLHHQARLTWSPAHDAQWLTHADLLQTGRAWAGAASYADTDPLAASAMRKSEDRLRILHPHAMARYDRLRSDGINPLDAMHDTAPLFGRSPDVRVGDPVPTRPALNASAGQDASQPASHPPGTAAERIPEPGTDRAAELRGRQIITRIQSSARAAGRSDLGPDELVMILEATTNLSHEVTGKITQQATAGGGDRGQQRHAKTSTRNAGLTAAVDLTTAAAHDSIAGLPVAHGDADLAGAGQADARDKPAAQLAAESFPHSAADAVRAVSTASSVRLARLARAPDITKLPSRPM